jgi:hypothetical protein
VGAGVVDVGRYRYSLLRWWAPAGAEPSRVTWVTLNPSTVRGCGDPTTRRVKSLSERWGFSSFEVVSLFAYRSPSPAHLWERRCDIVGRQNRDYLRAAIFNAERVVVAWGAAKDERVALAVAQLVGVLRPAGIRAVCLGTNSDGSPKHPLSLRADAKLERWHPAPP